MTDAWREDVFIAWDASKQLPSATTLKMQAGQQ